MTYFTRGDDEFTAKARALIERLQNKTVFEIYNILMTATGRFLANISHPDTYDAAANYTAVNIDLYSDIMSLCAV
jgi:hypothetical protein